MKYALMCTLTLALLGSLYTENARAQAQELNSGNLPLQLLELYTSEGCSSCPNADRWLSDIAKSSELWTTYIPIAFHVDYWNKLGWKDRFSSSRYSRRQRTHRIQGNIESVYTPGFVVAGKEWRGWFSRRPLPSMQTEVVGNLQLHIKKNRRYIARFDRLDKSRTPLQLTIALLGMNLETKVKHGENAGKRLQHDFVVLDMVEDVSNAPLWQGTLPKASNEFTANNTKLAIAAWVSEVGKLAPIQAVGGYLLP